MKVMAKFSDLIAWMKKYTMGVYMYTNYVYTKYFNIVVGIKTLAMYIHRLFANTFWVSTRLETPSFSHTLSLSVFLTSPYNHWSGLSILHSGPKPFSEWNKKPKCVVHIIERHRLISKQYSICHIILYQSHKYTYLCSHFAKFNDIHT